MIIIVSCMLCLFIWLYKSSLLKREELRLKEKWLALGSEKEARKKATLFRVDSMTPPLLKRKYQKAVIDIGHLVAHEYPDGYWQFLYNNVGNAFCLEGSYFHIKITSVDLTTETRTVLLSRGVVIGLEPLENEVTAVTNSLDTAKKWFTEHKDKLWKSNTAFFTIPKEMFPLEIAEDICKILIENGFTCAIPNENGITVETD